jgi:hypothetical protein
MKLKLNTNGCKVLALCCLLIGNFLITKAQVHEPCGSATVNERLLQQDSAFKKSLELYEQKTLKYVKEQQALGPFTKKATVYSIPVVVHVIHLGEPIGTGTNISDAQITSAIDGINKRWRNLIGNGSTDMEVEFCLAGIDPNGMATTGINRVNGTVVSNYSNGGIDLGGCSTSGDEIAIKNLSKWPNTDYYNIWIVKDICHGAAAGYAYYPGASASVDGAVVTYNYFVYNQTAAAHEMGHGFGLYHTFQGAGTTTCPTNTSCASDGDKCCDTPPHKQDDCLSTNPCSGTGVWNNSMYNWMSYCGYDWPNQTSYGRFTDNQKSRVISSIVTGSRSSLTSSGKCVSVPPTTCAPANDNCSGATVLMDTNVFVYTNGTVDCATNDSTFAKASCHGSVTTHNGVFYKFIAAGTSTTVVVNPFNTTNVGLDPTVVVYSGNSCGNLTEIACTNPPGYTYVSLPVSGLIKGNTYWIRVYHAGSTPPVSGQGRFQICVRRGLSTCNSPAAMVADVSGTDQATLACAVIGGSGGPVNYKWYKGLTCSGTVLGTDSQFTATQAGYYVCKAYIEGFEQTCSSCDPGMATINYSCVSPALTVNDTTGTDSVLLIARVPAGTNVLYKWYKDSVCAGNEVGTDSVYMAKTSGYYSCKAYVDGYDFVCASCDKAYVKLIPSCGIPVVTVNDATGVDSVQLVATSVGGTGGTVKYKWYNDSICGGNVVGTGTTFMAKTSGYYSCKAYIDGREDVCYSCDKAYAKVKPFSNDIVMAESGTYIRCLANFYDGGNLSDNYAKGQNDIVTIKPAIAGAKLSVTFQSFKTQIAYKDSTDTTVVRNDVLYVYNGSSVTSQQIGALMGKIPSGTITSTAADGSLTFKFVSYNPRVLGDSNTRAGWRATVSCNYQGNDVTMLASGVYTTCGGQFYDGGGATGDYPDNQKMIGGSGGTVVTLNPAETGKKMRVVFNSFATQTQYKDLLDQTILNDDVLSVYNGNTIQAPLLTSLQGQRTKDTVTSTAADGSLTFKFVSSAPFVIPTTGTSRAGWSGTISCFMPPPPQVGIGNMEDPLHLKVYPNPTKGLLMVTSSYLVSDHIIITLTNTLGQVVSEKEIHVDGSMLETSMDISGIADGVYFMMIRSDSGTSTVKVHKQMQD